MQGRPWLIRRVFCAPFKRDILNRSSLSTLSSRRTQPLQSLIDKHCRKNNVALVLASLMSVGALLSWNTVNCKEEPCENGRNKPIGQYRGKYVLYREIGRGGFSIVHLALDTELNELVAAKVFDPKYANIKEIKSEIDIMEHLGQHDNIVSLRDVLFLPKETILIIDLIEGGELFDYIVEMGNISERDASRILRDVCTALDYIHSAGVCHRDLKPENLLLSDKSTEADIKIADFGLSRHQKKGEKILEKNPHGTIAYWAPEIICRHPQDFGVDMWAFGVLAYIVLTGIHPFDPRGDRNDAEVITEIATGKYDTNNKYYRALSEDAKDFLAQMLQSDPSKRYSAKVALQHPWLQGQTSSTLPLPEGHAQRIEAYLRLQKLRANVLAVIMGLSHSNIINSSINTSQTQMEQKIQTANLDMFKEAFAIFDRDDSGDIDREELRVVLMALGQNVYITEIEEMMKQADSDGDGKISFDEFVSMMSKRLLNKGQFTEADLKASFKIFDHNHDGFISCTELEYMLHVLGNKFSSSEVKKMIKLADVNGDGKIDYHEFTQLMIGNKKAPSY